MAKALLTCGGMTRWKTSVNGKEYDVTIDNGSYSLNGKPLHLDIAEIRENEFSVISDNKSYNVEVVQLNHAEKKCTIKVNGNEYELEMKDKMDLLLQKMGMNKRAAHAGGSLKAPMPGKVLRVDVKEGQTVKKGDSILILEAMKMENAIKAPGDGTVKSVRVKAGDAVEKGEVMVEMG